MYTKLGTSKTKLNFGIEPTSDYVKEIIFLYLHFNSVAGHMIVVILHRLDVANIRCTRSI